MRALWLLAVVSLCVACSEPATFRPAKGVKEFPATKDAYRVNEERDGCFDIGFVIQARRVDDIAETAAAHGGTHYMILDDFGGTSVETDTSGSVTRFGAIDAQSSSYAVKHHVYTARVYHCS